MRPPAEAVRADAEAAIRRLQQELARAFHARDFAAVLRCYAADAVLLAPGRPAAVGHAAIGAELRSAFTDPAVDVDVRIERIEVSEDGCMAHAWGTGLTTVDEPGPDGSGSIASKWLAVYRREDDGWRLAADCFNLDTPMT